DAVSDIGPGTTTYAPYARPDFAFSPMTDVRTIQWTPGVAYRGAWRDVAQLSLGVQKVYYERTVATGAYPTVSYSTSPLLLSATASAQLTRDLLVYGSYTRGFE